MDGCSDSPLVTVVIPAFNKAAYLDDAVHSVLAQDYPHIELLVFDDGSTDDTEGVLKRYGNRFYWESHENMGQSATLNKGWRMSRGEILSYLSADDVLRPGCVRAAVEAMQAHPGVVLTYCDFELIDPLSRPIRTVRAENFDYRRMVAEFVCTPGPGVFFRRTAFERAGGWDASLRQMPDYEYWLRLGLLGDFRRIPRTLAAFRVHETSLTFSVTSELSAEEPVRIMEKYFGLANVPPEIRREQLRATSNALLFSAQLHLRSGRFRTAFRHTRRAAALFPANLFRLSVLRRIVNALLNRMGHRLLWLLKPSRAPKLS
jgi:glycosyltransferase involved in cell wall biosynthesis